MPEWLTQFCAWLEQTPFSQTLQNVEWAVPALQVVHILALSAVISAVFAITLRLFGLLAADRALAPLARSLLRVIWWSLPLLLVSGAALISAEPLRSLGSKAFQIKMVLLAASIAIGFGFQRALAAPGSRLESPPGVALVRTGAAIAALLWIGIIFAGRWIAYAPGR